MQTETVITSGGDGTWERASRQFTNPAAGYEAPDEDNPFEGMSQYMDANRIAPAFAGVFNKVMEHEYRGVCYRYREVSLMELLTLGTNPFLLEAMSSLQSKRTTEEYREELASKSPDEIKSMTAQAKLHRNKVLLHSLIDMRVGSDVMNITAEHIAAMQDDVLDNLYSVISGEGTAETEAVRQFPDESGEGSGGDDLSPSDEVR